MARAVRPDAANVGCAEQGFPLGGIESLDVETPIGLPMRLVAVYEKVRLDMPGCRGLGGAVAVVGAVDVSAGGGTVITRQRESQKTHSSR